MIRSVGLVELINQDNNKVGSKQKEVGKEMEKTTSTQIDGEFGDLELQKRKLPEKSKERRKV